MSEINTEADLRSNYRPVNEAAKLKQIDHLDDGARQFLASATLAVVATFGPDGADNSPRGGPPGFLRVLDDRRLAFGDLSGNNRLDSYSNLTENPVVGMLCIVPGLDETMRINGTASLTTDEAVLAATAIDGRTPKVAVVVEVSECYIHCAKALRRSKIWDTSSWPAADRRPSAAKILTDHMGIDIDPAVVEAGLEANYEATIWERGGS